MEKSICNFCLETDEEHKDRLFLGGKLNDVVICAACVAKFASFSLGAYERNLTAAREKVITEIVKELRDQST